MLHVVSASSSPGPRQGWEGALSLEVLGKCVSQLLPVGSDQRILESFRLEKTPKIESNLTDRMSLSPEH